MGSGKWTSDAYAKYAATTNYVSASREQVFVNRRMPQALDPSKITVRESCDSIDNPNSTAIILALDVTGSMGEYAELIAKKELPKLMTEIYEKRPVTDPHVMFMGIDDIHHSRGGDLQISQFEADIRILEQLREIWLVQGGGSNRSESYDLPWWFAANRTKIDCFEKRNQKGFLFTFGDEEAPYEILTEAKLRRVFGEGQYSNTSPKQALEAAQEKFHVFHIVIEQGSYFRSNRARTEDSWTKLLGSNVLFLQDFQNLTSLVVATMNIVNGKSLKSVISESSTKDWWKRAFKNVRDLNL